MPPKFFRMLCHQNSRESLLKFYFIKTLKIAVVAWPFVKNWVVVDKETIMANVYSGRDDVMQASAPFSVLTFQALRSCLWCRAVDIYGLETILSCCFCVVSNLLLEFALVSKGFCPVVGTTCQRVSWQCKDGHFSFPLFMRFRGVCYKDFVFLLFVVMERVARFGKKYASPHVLLSYMKSLISN
jgi:hypothetical protein